MAEPPAQHGGRGLRASRPCSRRERRGAVGRGAGWGLSQRPWHPPCPEPAQPAASGTACGWACSQEALPVQDPAHWELTLSEKGFTLSPPPGCDPLGQGHCQCLPTPPWTSPQSLGTSTHVTQLLLGCAPRRWAPAGGRRDVYVSALVGAGCWSELGQDGGSVVHSSHAQAGVHNPTEAPGADYRPSPIACGAS